MTPALLPGPIKALVLALLVLAVPSVLLGHSAVIPAPGAQVARVGSGAVAALVEPAAGAGFSGPQLVTAVAVGLAESGGRSDALGLNSDGSRDRGPWQINDRAHPDVSDACAFDPPCAAQAAYAISIHGSDWWPWTTYASGKYRQFVPAAEAAVNGR
jgi:hypothetical protein